MALDRRLAWSLVILLAMFINLSDGANLAPTCEKSYYNVSVTEGNDVGYSVLKVSCSDPESDTLAFEFDGTGGNTNTVFQINGATGELTLAKKADAEEKTSSIFANPFTIRVKVKDGTNTLLITYFVYIESINDNAAKISSLTPSPVSVREDTKVGAKLANCTLKDDDFPGSGHDVPYVKITAGNDDGMFALDYITCDLMLVKSLDYEKVKTYTLTYQAYNTEPLVSPDTTSTASIVVNVLNVNDNAPNCSAYNIIADVLESAGVIDVLKKLSCSDAETAGAITYTIVKGNSTSLKINPGTGDITLQAPVDYDAGMRYLEITVSVSDGDPSGPKTTEVIVGFRIADVDDNPPEWSGNNSASVLENADLGTVVIDLNATDKDSPNTAFSKITYGFEVPCTSDWFKIDQYTGSIIVKELMDYEINATVTCTVFAYSSDKSSNKKLTFVTINLIDVNDRPPEFEQYLFEGNVSEKATTGTPVAQIKATDPDTGINKQFDYSMPYSSPFSIDASTGLVTLTGSIDYENEQAYLILIEAKDKGFPPLTSQTYLNVKVLPVNEFEPAFSAYGVQTVSEGAAPGTNIVKISASDNDTGADGTLMYHLLNASVPFILESQTGQLRVGIGLDRELESAYNLTIIATDSSQTAVKSATMTLSVQVSDVNDNPPDCTPLVTLSPRPTDTTNVLVTFACTDKDSGSTGFSFSLISAAGNYSSLFAFDPKDGAVRLAKDAIEGIYTFVVKITDNGNPAMSTTIAVEYKLDAKAQLKLSILPATIHVVENREVGESIMNITSSGTYQAVIYDIVSGNEEHKFDVHHTTGNLRLISPLDRETTDSYTLGIKVSTSTGLSATSTLTVTVDDYNDNAPRYSNSFYKFTYAEDITVPTLIAKITGTDADILTNAAISYSICGGDSNKTFDYTAGNLTIKKKLDYETTPSYTLTLCAVDGGVPSLTGTTVVFVAVSNTDDNLLTIQAGGNIALTLPEDATVGSRVLQIAASDADTGSELFFAITYQSVANMFSIGEHTGDLFLNYPLDRESLSKYSVRINVTNNAVPARSNATAVNITVADVNDNDPVFSVGNAVFSAAHGTPANTLIGALNVTDNDLGLNGTFVLGILDGDNAHVFKFINSNLYSAAVLSVRDASIYSLTVTATDKGSPPRTSTAYVTVLIEPEYKQPSFNPTTQSLSEEETLSPGSLLIQVKATYLNALDGASGDLVYSIISGNTNNAFFIEPYKGHVQLLKSLSYATNTYHTLVILAQNRYKPSLNSTLTLNITVIQVNLYAPQFTQDLYVWSINEIAAVGTSVGTISTTDNDKGQFGVVTFAIESGAPFTVNATTGRITSTSLLEYSQAKSYNFYAKAVDNAGDASKTSYVVVVINVKDFNNHAPAFTKPYYNITLLESLAVGEAFASVLATDLDSGTYGTIKYSIISGNTASKFSLDEDTGALSLAGALDYETSLQYILLIKAKDLGTPELNSTIPLLITVANVNDKAPVFSPTRVNLDIPSDSPALTYVYTAAATDIDFGLPLSYLIESGNDQGLFSIGTVTGQIKTSRSLGGFDGFYTLTVCAVDRGVPFLTGTVTVVIAVNPVSISPTGWSNFTVNENEPSGSFVGVIYPSDAGITGYTITGGNYNNSFEISFNSDKSATLRTRRLLDREAYPYYQLLVARTTSNPISLSDVTVVIEVLDQNDNAPVFGQSLLSLYVVENTPSGISLGQLSWKDADNGDNGTVDVAISQQSTLGAQYFSLSSSGVLTLKKSINYEQIRSLKFYVLARDRGTPQRTSTATVTVTVLDVVEKINYEVFNSTSFISHEFPHDAANGDVVCTLTPEDFDLDPTVSRSNKTTSVGFNVFNVSSFASSVILNMKERVFENGRYFQWMILTTTTLKDGTKSYVGLIRLDTFNKDKHLVAVTTAMDFASLGAQKSTIRDSLQTKFSKPNYVKIWDIQSVASTTGRRRLLADESVALVLVLADQAADDINNVDQTKSFLTQDAILSALQGSKDGTPVAGLDASISKVLPYRDVVEDSGLDTSMIVLIVFACIAGLVIIGVIIALLVYYCVIRRKK
ncbi:unnamed protein product [Lymnaea stagnalis]|uniref:Cadherin domain-containing protein n=1 Tax=Lymnaea stagnalis TaxID=6523 RepID=A0AAV2HW05_LYMST